MVASQSWTSEGAKTNTSKPFPVSVSGTTKIYTVKTETNIDKNKNVSASKLTLQDSVTGRSGTTERALATSSDGGKTWTPTKDANGKPILSSSEISALVQDGSLNNAAKNATQSSAKENGAVTQQLNQLSNGNVSAGITTSGLNLEENQKNLDATKISDDPDTRKVSEYPSSGYLKYPLTLKLEEQDCIKFTMLEYAPRQINLQAISKGTPLSARDTNTNRTRGSTVVLPIQPSITDSNTVQWGSNEMNAAEMIAASAAFGAIKGGGDAMAESLTAAAELLQNANSDIKNTIAAGFADKAAGTKGLLTRITGGIVNPNMELLFEGPQLRSFTFNFTLSAREEKESKYIRNIIRFFKQGMSVKRAKTGLFLKSPHTFEIKYMYKNKEHGWINKIKECALTSCNVNYTPSGNYATYYDGSMTSYELTLGFSELEPIYDDDYGKGSKTFETEIGY
jgi:hypothetical protein